MFSEWDAQQQGPPRSGGPLPPRSGGPVPSRSGGPVAPRSGGPVAPRSGGPVMPGRTAFASIPEIPDAYTNISNKENCIKTYIYIYVYIHICKM